MIVSATALRCPPLATKTTHRIQQKPPLPLNRLPASSASLKHRLSQCLLQRRPSSKEGSLRREDSSARSVSSARNKSCQQEPLQQGMLMERSEIPKVSAKSWMLYEMREGRSLYGRRNYKKREMASLTKMMNLVAILHLVDKTGVDPQRVRVRASKNSCSMIGTTAQLAQGAIYSLYDLFFGMMLPSGNDAAYLIAEVGGILARMLREDKVDVDSLQDVERMEEMMGRGNNVSLFLREMNIMAWQIGMGSSNFANPHGLANPSNYSTALDLCKLCTHAMKNPLFRAIVSTQTHHYQLEMPHPDIDKENRHPNAPCLLTQEKALLSLKWQNTNRMLGAGWTGIKTGITPSAGPCLAASVAMTLSGKEYEFLVILLQSESMEARWAEVRRLVDWAVHSKLYLPD